MFKNILIFMSVATVWINTSCKPQKEGKEEEKEFLVTTPALADTTVTRDYVCQIRSINHIELRAQEKGYLQKIFVDEGQFVKKGQFLKLCQTSTKRRFKKLNLRLNMPKSR
jgi:membrane fusion protein (multidrug efflux system)